MAIHGWSGDCQSNSGVWGYSDIGGYSSSYPYSDIGGQGFFQDLGQGGAKRQYVIWWGGMALSTCTALPVPRGGESEPRGGKCSPPPPPERNPGGVIKVGNHGWSGDCQSLWCTGILWYTGIL